MKQFFKSEIGAAVIWVICTLLLAAVISPWFYRGGMSLAAASEARELPALFEWLGAACGRSRFSRFFNRSLWFSALVFLPLLFHRIRHLRSAAETAPEKSWRRVSWKPAVVQIVTGCIIAGGLLWGIGMILEASGAYVHRTNSPAAGKLLLKALGPAIGASVLEEWLFRGVLLGLWLRFARPVAACVGTSLLFAFLHFLNPPTGAVIADPSHALAGFELLGDILLRFTNPLFFVADFATLLLVGLILAWARMRTGSLWFSIGLHSGWILAFKSFNLLYQDVPNSPLRPWGVGDSLRSGVLPLITLGVTAVICRFVLRRLTVARPVS